MAGDYPVRTIGDVCYVTDGAHAKVERREHGIPYLTSKNIGHGRLLLGKLDFISAEDFERLFTNTLRAQRRPSKGDVLIGIIGTFGNAYLYKESDHFGISSAVALLRPDPRKLDPGFLYSVVTSPTFQSAHSAYKSGSAQGYTNIPTIKRLPIPLPPLPEQRAISHILGTLNDKIALDREMNETLERIALALFKLWFVETTENGLPQGWRESELGEIASVIDCLHSKKPERQTEGKPLLQLGNIRDDGLIDMADPYYVTEDDYRHWISRMEATPGDCVITNVGRVAATAQIPEDFHAALGRNMTGLRCRPEFPYPTFLIECLRSSNMKEEILLRTDTGTILDALNVRSIPKLRFTRPTNEEAASFEATCRPFRARMEQNLEESRTLAALRDALLPKLLSGEIRISVDASKP